MIKKLIWIATSLTIFSFISFFIFKKENKDIDFFNTVVLEQKEYSLKNLIKDSPSILKKIKEIIVFLGILKFILYFVLCLSLRTLYFFVLMFWLIITYFRLKEYEKNWDVGAFCIKEKEFEYIENKGILNLFFIFIPKCSSFCIIYILKYSKKKKIFINEKAIKKTINALIILMVLGTSIWNLFIFIDIIESLKDLNKNFKNENAIYKYKIFKKDIKTSILTKYASSIKIAEQLRIFKSEEGLKFNSRRGILAMQELKNISDPETKIVKVWSQNKQEKWKSHPGLYNNFEDSSDKNEKTGINIPQLTKTPIENSKFFELVSKNKKNFLIWNIIQHNKNIELYGKFEKQILENNGITDQKKFNAVKFFTLIHQLNEKNCSRIYELPDGKKVVVEDENNFIAGVLLDQKKDWVVKNNMFLPQKQLLFFQKANFDFKDLKESDMSTLEIISGTKILNLHQPFEGIFREHFFWLANEKFRLNLEKPFF